MTYSRDPFYGRYPWKKLRRQVRVAGLPLQQSIETRARVGLRTAEPDDVLCVHCHNREEPRNGTPQRGCDIDGNPLNALHPWNVGGDGQK